jgi:hypothetical protein
MGAQPPTAECSQAPLSGEQPGRASRVLHTRAREGDSEIEIWREGARERGMDEGDKTEREREREGEGEREREGEGEREREGEGEGEGETWESTTSRRASRVLSTAILPSGVKSFTPPAHLGHIEGDKG